MRKKESDTKNPFSEVPAKVPAEALVEVPVEPPSKQKIMSMLSSPKMAIRREVCMVLAAGLKATKTIVFDEKWEKVVDFEVRRRYAETILEALGEKKSIVNPELHLHFTSILTQIRAYERGDPRAIEQAGAAGDE